MKKQFFLTILCTVLFILSNSTFTFASGDSFTDPESIDVNVQYEMPVLPKDTSAFYTFTLPSDGTVSLSFGKYYEDYKTNNSYTRGWRVYLYSQTQELICSRFYYTGNTTTETTCNIGLPAGKYYIKVSVGTAWWCPSVNYKIKINYTSTPDWEKEFNNTFYTPNKIVLDKKIYASIMSDGDIDIFEIAIPTSGEYVLYFGKDYSEYESNGSHSKGWNIELLNSEVVRKNSFFVKCGNTSTESHKIYLSSGINYIKVYPDWSAKINYNISVKRYTPPIYSISYILNGGQNNSLNPSEYCDSDIFLKDPVKQGYIFRGWYLDNHYDTRVTKILSSWQSNITLYANWEKVSNKKIPNTKVSVGKTKITVLKNVYSKKVKLKFKKIKKATGYQIIYSTKKNMKSARRISTKQTSYILKNLKRNKTYYVKVRAYYKPSLGKIIYGKYSDVKKVKVRK